MVAADCRDCGGVILAAGRSQRAGSWKPGLVVAGKTLLVHAVESLVPWCRSIVVVAGPDSERIGDLLAGHPHVTVVVNPRRDEGMFTSVQAGVGAVESTRTALFLQPVDCPVVPAEVFEALCDTFLAHGAGRAVIPCHGGRGGHPVLLPGNLRRAILAAGPGSTLREILARAGAVRAPVASPAVLTDVDTPADIARLRALLEGA